MARADRPALTGGGADRPADPYGDHDDREVSRRAVEAVWRIESARIVGALARYAGDFGLAEDVAQQALAEGPRLRNGMRAWRKAWARARRRRERRLP
jgi:hypothetical protein